MVRLTVSVAFPVLIIYEWKRWPNGSEWLGPFGMMWYNGFDVASLIIILVSLIMLLAFLIKPKPLTGLISMLGFINWIFWGMVAQGIGC